MISELSSSPGSKGLGGSLPNGLSNSTSTVLTSETGIGGIKSKT